LLGYRNVFGESSDLGSFVLVVVRSHLSSDGLLLFFRKLDLRGSSVLFVVVISHLLSNLFPLLLGQLVSTSLTWLRWSLSWVLLGIVCLHLSTDLLFLLLGQLVSTSLTGLWNLLSWVLLGIVCLDLSADLLFLLRGELILWRGL